MKKNGELLRFKEGWDLAESYPESFRQRMAQTTETPKRGKKKPIRHDGDPAKNDATHRFFAAFRFFHIARAAFDAMSRRCSGDKFCFRFAPLIFLATPKLRHVVRQLRLECGD
jgi:hypothetical protein